MGSISAAEPRRLLTFEHVARVVFDDLQPPARQLRRALDALRSDAFVGQFLSDIPALDDEADDLRATGRFLSGWVGDVGRAFRRADRDGDGRVVLLPFVRLPVDRLRNGDATVMRVGGRVVVDTGSGDDHVSVRSLFGLLVIDVNGTRTVLAGDVVLRLGGGNDTVEVATDVRIGFTLLGQTGDDVLEGGAGDDVIRGGDGRDYIDGYRGDDVLDGGAGNDVAYGGDGADVVLGGDGVDHLEGGAGADAVLGGADHDILSGGSGDDLLDGGGGGDTTYTGAGSDVVADRAGGDTVYGQADDTVVGAADDPTPTRFVTVDLSGLPPGSTIHIEGSDRFRQRMVQDLDMLRSSPDGRLMLAAADDISARGGDHWWSPSGDLTITEHRGRDNSGYGGNEIHQSRSIVEIYPGTYTPRPGRVAYQETPPVVVLFHEMAHHYDHGFGTTRSGTYPEPGRRVRNAERQAVGLPIDTDGLPWTPGESIDPNHPLEYTENGLREEMGLPARPRYGRP